jgi:hypothetical protein
MQFRYCCDKNKNNTLIKYATFLKNLHLKDLANGQIKAIVKSKLFINLRYGILYGLTLTE